MFVPCSCKRRCRPCPDPTLSRYQPSRYFGSVSETLEDLLDDYVDANPHGLLCDEEPTKRGLVQKGKFSTMIDLKFMRSLTEPGEGVGLLASQVCLIDIMEDKLVINVIG